MLVTVLTLLDWQAAKGEKNSKAARRVVKLLDKIDLDSLVGINGDFDLVSQLYHDCARVCLEGDKPPRQLLNAFARQLQLRIGSMRRSAHRVIEVQLDR